MTKIYIATYFDTTRNYPIQFLGAFITKQKAIDAIIKFHTKYLGKLDPELQNIIDALNLNNGDEDIVETSTAYDYSVREVELYADD